MTVILQLVYTIQVHTYILTLRSKAVNRIMAYGDDNDRSKQQLLDKYLLGSEIECAPIPSPYASVKGAFNDIKVT